MIESTHTSAEELIQLLSEPGFTAGNVMAGIEGLRENSDMRKWFDKYVQTIVQSDGRTAREIALGNLKVGCSRLENDPDARGRWSSALGVDLSEVETCL